MFHCVSMHTCIFHFLELAILSVRCCISLGSPGSRTRSSRHSSTRSRRRSPIRYSRNFFLDFPQCWMLNPAKCKCLDLFLIKSCKLLIPRPPQSTSKLQEKPSAQKWKHPAPQKMKFLNFLLFSWAIFALLDSDPSTTLLFPEVNGSGFGFSLVPRSRKAIIPGTGP